MEQREEAWRGGKRKLGFSCRFRIPIVWLATTVFGRYRFDTECRSAYNLIAISSNDTMIPMRSLRLGDDIRLSTACATSRLSSSWRYIPKGICQKRFEKSFENIYQQLWRSAVFPFPGSHPISPFGCEDLNFKLWLTTTVFGRYGFDNENRIATRFEKSFENIIYQ